MKKLLMFLCAATLVFGTVGSVNALTIYGSVWTGITDGDDVVRTFDWEGTDATASFTIEGEFNFESTVSGATYNDFLSGIGNTNTVTWTVNDIGAMAMDTAGGFAGSFFQFNGFAYFDENEKVRHDDGIWMTLLDLSDYSEYEAGYDDPTAPHDTYLGNAAGAYGYSLNYIESNRLPAVLIMDLDAAPVPEPATMMLFGIGLLGLAGVSRRKK